MLDYAVRDFETLASALATHMEITGIAFLIAILLAVIVSIFLIFYPKLQQSFIYGVSLLYAVPSFAFFALLIPWTGLNKTTAIIVLVLYAQYTLIRQIVSGINQIDRAVIEASKGMGMNRWQLLFKIQLPLTKPAIFAGLHLAATSIIAIATIAATINAGGLGTIIFDGLRTMSLIKILWGIILVVFWSLFVNICISILELILKRPDEVNIKKPS